MKQKYAKRVKKSTKKSELIRKSRKIEYYDFINLDTL